MGAIEGTEESMNFNGSEASTGRRDAEIAAVLKRE
jgi:hypothetical protein